jgi:alpha/beta superfamily hydrolase
VNGDKDRVVPTASVAEMSVKTKVQRGIKLEHAVVPGANHFFQDKIEDLVKVCGAYVDTRMVEILKAKREAKD